MLANPENKNLSIPAELFEVAKRNSAKFIRSDLAGRSDYESAAHLGIAQAVRQYNPNKGELQNFASQVIQCRLIDAWNKREKIRRISPLDVSVGEDKSRTHLDTITNTVAPEIDFELEQLVVQLILKRYVNKTCRRISKYGDLQELVAKWAELRLIRLMAVPDVCKLLKLSAKDESNLRTTFKYEGVKWLHSLPSEDLKDFDESITVKWLRSLSINKSVKEKNQKRASKAANRVIRNRTRSKKNETAEVDLSGTCAKCGNFKKHWRGYACGVGGLWIGPSLPSCQVPRWCPKQFTCL